MLRNRCIQRQILSLLSRYQTLHDSLSIATVSSVSHRCQSTKSKENSDQIDSDSVSNIPDGSDYFRAIAQQVQETPSPISGRAVKDFWKQFNDPDKVKSSPSTVADFSEITPDIRLKGKSGKLQRLDEIPLEDVDLKELEKDDPEKRPLEPIPDSDSSLKEVDLLRKPFAFNLAAYANDSENIQRLVEMGIEVYKLDADKEVSQRVMTCEWDSKIQPYFGLMDKLKIEDYNEVISRYPRILVLDLKDIETRIDYFTSKKFAPENIGKIMAKCPQVFAMTVLHIDKTLGSLQKEFRLTGQEVRDVIISQPKLIIRHESETLKFKLSMINEMGFSKEETKAMLVAYPKLFLQDREGVLKRFDYLHNVIKLPHELLAKFPQAIRAPPIRVRERHLYLKALKRDQYDPKLPNYVSPGDLCLGTDGQFCENVAKTSKEQYNAFLKTL